MRFFRSHSTSFALGLTLALAAILPFAVEQTARGQAISQNGGSIQGTVTDQTGAVIAGAKVTIASPDTGSSKVLTTDAAGLYSLGPLPPGKYTITVEVAGFERLVLKTVVAVGTVSAGNAKLKIGSAGITVEVDAGALQINTEQVGVAGIVSQEQLDTLPVNGHNVLDTAQLQPGVILQSGMTFDPTKAGYSALSVGGIGGRSTRILLDGQDITDETVGTTIFNVPSGAVGELQLNRSTQDVSGEVTSTGQVLEVTKAGTNTFHGNVFYNFQDQAAGFADVLGESAPFQRSQFGGYAGGRILKDKLFFYGGGERVKQMESDAATGYDPAFAALAAQYPYTPAPFKDNFSFGRIDYHAPHDINLFVRAVYSVNADDATFGSTPYAVYLNRDNVPGLVGGADFTTGRLTHSFRLGYEKFHNLLVDGTGALGGSIYNPTNILGFPVTLYGSLNAGQNYLAPQGTFQSDKQARYDVSWTKGAHTIKFGGELNRVLGGGFAEFYGASLFTELFTSTPDQNTPGLCNDDPTLPACPGDPLKGYSASSYYLGNGNGLFTEKPAFGLKGGGEFSWRVAAYIGDTWKATQDLTISAGVRWGVDTDRANQDLPSPTCGSVDPSLQWSGCNSTSNGSAYLFDQYQQGLGGKVHQPYGNFGPQLGFVYSPGSRKTAFRGGIGIYYENDIFNNTGNARPEEIPTSSEVPFFGVGVANYAGTSIYLPGLGAVTEAPDGTPVSAILTKSIFNAAPEIYAIRQAWQKVVQNVNAPNPNFIGTGYGLYADNIYAKPYVSPYSIQFNGGVQHEFTNGIMLSVDYVHNAVIKVPMSIDVNHDGAARTLNTAAASTAIAGILSTCGAATIDAAIQSCPKLYPNGGGVGISDFAAAGLDSGAYLFGGAAASAYGATPNTGAAFGGTNPNVGEGLFILPEGRSGYDALQAVFQEHKQHPAPGLVTSDFQISYSLSRVVATSNGSGSSSSDQFFGGSRTYDNDDPTRYIGRSNLDHTNELSFGGTIGVKGGLEIGTIGHFYSALPSTLTINTGGQTVGQIFQTDLDGDGTIGDLLPGTEPGGYMHQVKASGLNNVIADFNSKYAGKLTPAGQELVAAGLFTQSQLSQLGAVIPTLAAQPGNNPRNNPAFRTLDANVSYPIKLKWLGEGTTIVPTASFYNVFNLANFGPVVTSNGGVLTVNEEASAQNYVNSPNTWANTNTSLRTLRNSGTFDQGGPRSTEFSLKFEF
jgi:hypothetical protein